MPKSMAFRDRPRTTAYCVHCPMRAQSVTGTRDKLPGRPSSARPEPGLAIEGAIASVGSVGSAMAPPNPHRGPPSIARSTSNALDAARLPSIRKACKGDDDRGGGEIHDHRLLIRVHGVPSTLTKPPYLCGWGGTTMTLRISHDARIPAEAEASPAPVRMPHPMRALASLYGQPCQQPGLLRSRVPVG